MVLALLRNIITGSMIGVLHLGIIAIISLSIIPTQRVPMAYRPPVMKVQFMALSETDLTRKVQVPIEENVEPTPVPVVNEQPTMAALQRVQMITRDLLDAALA